MSATASFRASSITFQPIVGEGGEEWAKVQVLARNGTLILRAARGGEVHRAEGVLRVERTARQVYTITTAEGTYTAQMEKGCGCR